MRRGRRDDERGADAGVPSTDEQHDTARYGGEQPPPGRPGPAYGEYGQPLFGRPAYGQPGYGSNPYPPPETSAAAPGAPAGPARGRPGRIVAVSLLVQLVVVAAAGNTWATRHLVDFGRDHGRLVRDFVTLPLVFAWRLTPEDGSTGNRFYLATMLGLLALFVVAALVSLALVRGPITFWRAFVGVWAAVLVGVLANGMVRRGVSLPGNASVHTRSILFQGGGPEIPAGLILGLVAGLIAAIVAVVSRRPAVVAVAPPVPAEAPWTDPEAPTPWYGDESRPAPEPYGTSPSMQKVQQSVGEDAPTEAFGTKRLPDVPPPPPPPAPHDQATMQFPAAGRTPDAGRTADAPVDAPADAPADEATRAIPVARPAQTPEAPVQAPSEAPSEARSEPLPEARSEAPSEAPSETPSEPSRSDDATQALPVAPPTGGATKSSRSGEAPRESDPPVGSDEPTAVRRPAGFGPVTRSTPAAPDAASTQAFPRPPDDEDLGHHPD